VLPGVAAAPCEGGLRQVPEAILIGIGGESFDLGAPLSEAARQGMEKALAQIRAMG